MQRIIALCPRYPGAPQKPALFLKWHGSCGLQVPGQLQRRPLWLVSILNFNKVEKNES